MYYIVNQDKQIIAADSTFLNLLEMGSLQELFTKVAGKQINIIESDDGQVEINTGSKNIALTKTAYPLSSVVGELTLIRISESINEQEISTGRSFIESVSDESRDDIKLLLDEDEDFLKPKEETIAVREETFPAEEDEDTVSFLKSEIGEESEAQEELLEEKLPEKEPTEEKLPEEEEEAFLIEEDDDTISFLKPETEKETKAEEIKTEEEPPREETIQTEDEEDIVSFILPEIDEKPEEELPKETVAEEPSEVSLSGREESITIDTEKISSLLGISKEEYSEFLNEFIDQSIELEPELKEKNSEVQKKALSTLQKLSQILHLPVASDLLEQVRESKGKTRKSLIAEFYNTLAELTIHTPEPQIEIPSVEKDEISGDFICDLDFSHIKPIHFDFRLEEAAEDLSLPVDLIEEFVNDFIEQAHAEKQTFIDACESGDIQTIQKTGHKLKGAASNLRINPLADTLEEVQFCKERSRFEPLLKKYWGQFLAFELFMKSKSH
ncbi:MAG: Hpt domain-containing protein [Campylobacterota bacterium]|nr:Hpt domain-containing protein [Campylobacterota bacterium]